MMKKSTEGWRDGLALAILPKILSSIPSTNMAGHSNL